MWRCRALKVEPSPVKPTRFLMALLKASMPSPVRHDTRTVDGESFTRPAGTPTKSILLSTHKVLSGLAGSLLTWATARSRTSRMRSAVSAAKRARRRPSTSTGSALSRKPAVSTKRTGRPSRTKSTLSKSRVVPGMSVTMAACSPLRRLSRLDLPTLDAPMMATLMPWESNAPCRLRWISDWTAPMSVSTCSPTRPCASSSTSSSGKSMAASTWTRSFRMSASNSLTRDENSPDRERTAPRAAWVEALAIKSATASAWAKSIWPLRKARSLNSPGRARRAPAASTAFNSICITTGPPWPCSSTTSSPVKELGAAKCRPTPSSSSSPSGVNWACRA